MIGRVLGVVLAVTISVFTVGSASEWNCLSHSIVHSNITWCETKYNSELAITIKLLDRKPKYFIVECLSQQLINVSDSHNNMLDGLDLNLGYDTNLVDLKSVMIKSCIVPQVSVCELIRRFRSSDVESSVSRRSGNDKRKCRFEDVSNIKHLEFYKTSMTKVNLNLLEGLENLEYLDMMLNKIQELPTGLFSSLSKLQYLDLGENNINHLDSFIFKNLTQLKKLFIRGNPLRNFPEQIFSGLKNLNTLDINNCSLEFLHSNLFSDLDQLINISLMKNNFSTLPKELFTSTKLLKTFVLFDNKQRLNLPSGFLSNLTKLEIVSLENNALSTVPHDLLHGCTSILKIYLKNNELTTLPADLFRDTSTLRYLDLSSNQLTSLPDGIFSSLGMLEVLKITNNRLTIISKLMFARLAKLTELYLQRNRLTSIESRAFPDPCIINTIYLSHNQLTFNGETIAMWPRSSPLSMCRNLQTINLANNSITEIFDDWKRQFVNLSEIDLRNNNFQRLKFGDLEFISHKVKLNLVNNNITHINMKLKDLTALETQKEITLFLKGNPIRCDCSLHTFLVYIQDPKSLKLVTDAVTCVSPSDLKGQLMAAVEASHVSCDLPGDCPERCTCRWRPHDGGFVVDCSSLGLRHPPHCLPWNDTWNHTEIHLEENWLETLPNMSLPGYDMVTKLFASHNNISKLNPENLSSKLQVLDLAYNMLTTQSTRSAFEYLLKKEWTFKNVTLGDNKWGCDCEARELLKFLHSLRGKVDNVTCLDGRPLMPLSSEDICSSPYELIIAFSAVVAIGGILLGILTTLYFRYQLEVKVWLYSKHICLWLVTEEELDKDKEYDAFICYSHKDGDFVENFLVPGLETGPYLFKLCLHVRDWVPGEWITTQIMRSVKSSRRTVIVLSPNFLESVWGLVEFRTAHKQTMSEGRARVIILLYGDLGSLDTLDPELRGYLSMNTYITWDDPWFWKKMHYALPHPLHIAHANKLRRIKRKPPSKTLGTDSEDEGGDTSLKLNTYTAAIVDPNYHVNGYLGLYSSSPKIKCIQEESKEQALS